MCLKKRNLNMQVQTLGHISNSSYVIAYVYCVHEECSHIYIVYKKLLPNVLI
jgi:hypothetical protein